MWIQRRVDRVFFCQAEDGIRDYKVTGVQTCALPISIGVPQPLILFGTEEQKRAFLPRVAKGEISAFALTERGAGSDPAKMETHAEPSPDGKYFILNGEKLWCTNGTKAGVMVVMAGTPPKMLK